MPFSGPSTTPLLTPDEHKRRILQGLIKGPVSILASFANKFIFTDELVYEWCFKHNVHLHLDVVVDESSVMNRRFYNFYVFELIKDEEL